MLNRCLLPLAGLALLSCSRSEPLTQAAPYVNTIALHQEFHIVLPEDHSSGYLWTLEDNYDKNTVGYIKSVWHGNEKGVHFNFEADAKGKTQLEFRLIKYRDTLEAKTFVVEVK